MKWQPLMACVRKELLLLSRDLHGVLLLFAMPMAFILVMSLTLQEQFAARSGVKLAVLAVDRDHSEASRRLLAGIGTSGAFELQLSADQPDPAALQQTLRTARFAFAIDVAADYGTRLMAAPTAGAPPLITVTVAPDTGKQTEAIFLAVIRETLGGQRMVSLLAGFAAAMPRADLAATTDTQLNSTSLAVQYAYRSGDPGATPSAVQQSVPSWLVFAVFFVVVPLSNTLIRERQLGTVRRLRSTNLGNLTLLAGKLIPYFAVNQLQVLLMLLVGSYLVPAFGGEALQLNGSAAALSVMAASLSIAALGFALLIAVGSSTTEQATLLGGTGNIILAAIGGIMVPKFLMPAAMQELARLSPMSWGLDGFLGVMLRGGHLADIWPEAVSLTAFGLSAMLLAWILQNRRTD